MRSFLPSGLSVGLSVPVDDKGVANVDLVGDAPRLTAEEAELMFAQLAWTLRQAPGIAALRVTIGGEDVPVPGGASQYPVDGGGAFDPAGTRGTTLAGLSKGRLVLGRPGDLSFSTGPFGVAGASLDAVALRPDAEVVAAVDTGGDRVRTVEVGADPDDPVRTVVTGGDFARPTWDVAGRLWVLDRRGGNARVLLLEAGRVREVRVPGLTGRAAKAIVVSRDGTRVVGVVTTAAGDQVVGARVLINGRGRVARAGSPFVVRPAEDAAIADLAWSGPNRIALLSSSSPTSFHEVDVVAADGATVGVDGLSTILSGRVVGLAGAPVSSSLVYAVYGDRYVDLVAQEEYDAGSLTLTQLDFAG
ncbi:LpqB family beta-propeller domain-containing protein [Nocardioides sp. J54]|uniref:LpqB family beta-propeller domain-containing protein n=1 Tax=Nocardioides sp. J54 TaxID=935866 RepID=UPI00048A48A1|nr:LpqB family beta-propeller domain-containing protein [Nocardioides sp. J54]